MLFSLSIGKIARAGIKLAPPKKQNSKKKEAKLVGRANSSNASNRRSSTAIRREARSLEKEARDIETEEELEKEEFSRENP